MTIEQYVLEPHAIDVMKSIIDELHSKGYHISKRSTTFETTGGVQLQPTNVYITITDGQNYVDHHGIFSGSGVGGAATLQSIARRR